MDVHKIHLRKGRNKGICERGKKKRAYQSIIKCNACALNKICMTNWLWETQSMPALWTLAKKIKKRSSLRFLSLWGSLCRERERQTGKKKKKKKRGWVMISDNRGWKTFASYSKNIIALNYLAKVLIASELFHILHVAKVNRITNKNENVWC